MSLGEVNLAATAAVGFMVPLSAQLDLAIFGPFGLSALQAELSAEFNAALSLNASLSISVSNPIAAFQQALAALMQVAASIQAAIASGIPTLGVELSASIASSAALSAALGTKLGGISALVEAALQVKFGAGQFVGELQASLGAGPIDVLTFGFDAPMTAAQVGIESGAMFQALPGILPTDPVSGVMIVTKNPAAAAAIAALFKVS
jgi:hypothetical protein